jgi:hypothetical protein
MGLFGSIKKAASDGLSSVGGRAVLGGIIAGPGGALAGAASSGLPAISKALTTAAPKVGLGTYKADEYKPNINDFQNNPQYDYRRSDLNGQLRNIDARQPRMQITSQNAATNLSTAAQLDQSQYGQTREQQMALAKQLTDQGNGIGPSLAQSQLQQGRDLAIANAMALGASQRGLTAGQGLRNISDQTVNANMQAAQEAARLRLQEQLQARQALQGVLGTIGGQDLNLANANAGYLNQTNLANAAYANNMNQFNANQNLLAQQNNQNAWTQQTNLNDIMNRFYNTGLMQQDINQQAAGQTYNSLGANIQGSMNAANASQFADSQKRLGDFVSKLGQAAMSGLSGGGLGGMGGSLGIAPNMTTPATGGWNGSTVSPYSSFALVGNPQLGSQRIYA